jgi:hypothetical protein
MNTDPRKTKWFDSCALLVTFDPIGQYVARFVELGRSVRGVGFTREEAIADLYDLAEDTLTFADLIQSGIRHRYTNLEDFVLDRHTVPVLQKTPSVETETDGA